MKSIQPNFEIAKTAFYQLFTHFHTNDKASMHILLNTVTTGCLGGGFHKKEKEFKEDMNKWLDTIDIRMVGKLIDVVVQYKGSIPGWMKNKQFAIDYNNSQALDLIRTNNLN